VALLVGLGITALLVWYVRTVIKGINERTYATLEGPESRNRANTLGGTILI
jgi:hypothetical protein